MCKNWNNFCALWILFLTFSLKSQAQSAKDSSHAESALGKTLTVSPIFLPQSNIFFKKKPGIRVNLGSPFSHWGIMCIGEYQLEKKTGISFRFRLGSLDYVNKLEGKH